MPNFSKTSLDKLATVHPDLQMLFHQVVKEFDCKVIEGYRGQEAQEKAYAEGKTKLAWPHSMHNRTPSLAIDVAPYPINWQDPNRFLFFAGFVMGTAHNLGIKILWGGDWNHDYQVNDNKFDDLVHFELVLEE